MKLRAKQGGFSLIELIGVLAIMSILASIILPNMLKRMDIANADAEASNLVSLASELEQYITTQFTIPSVNTWASAIASVSALPINEVSSNKYGFKRGFYVDPKFFTATDVVFLDYKQTTGLLAPPVSPRIILVSDLKGNALPAPTTSAAFDAIWNQTPATSVLESDTLKVHRIYLGYLFHPVLLLNSSTQIPSYQLNTQPTKALPIANNGSNGQLTIYVINRTQLSLHQDPYPTGTVQYTLFIQDQDSFLYGTDGVLWFWGRP